MIGKIAAIKTLYSGEDLGILVEGLANFVTV